MREYDFEPTTVERIAFNDERFDRNAQLPQAVDDPPSILFHCECVDPMCRSGILLTLDEYVEIRAKPAHYLAARGHQIVAGPALVVREIAEGLVIERPSRERTAV